VGLPYFLCREMLPGGNDEVDDDAVNDDDDADADAPKDAEVDVGGAPALPGFFSLVPVPPGGGYWARCMIRCMMWVV